MLRTVDCLDKVLKLYESSEITKYVALIEIMKEKRKDSSNSLKIRNCLILLINLCFEIENPDYLFNKGKLVNELTEHEKSQLSEILRCEFNIH